VAWAGTLRNPLIGGRGAAGQVVRLAVSDEAAAKIALPAWWRRPACPCCATNGSGLPWKTFSCAWWSGEMITLLRKELLEQWRTYRFLVVAGSVRALWPHQPADGPLHPEIIKSLAGPRPSRPSSPHPPWPMLLAST